MKSLNLKSLLLAMTAALFVFSSCKKNNEDVPPPAAPTIEGTWVGKYGSGNNTPATYYSFTISKDGTMTVTDDANKPTKSAGTWKLEGETFIGQYQHLAGNLLLKYNVVAKYKATEKRMDGSWGLGTTDADDGTFFLDKQ